MTAVNHRVLQKNPLLRDEPLCQSPRKKTPKTKRDESESETKKKNYNPPLYAFENTLVVGAFLSVTPRSKTSFLSENEPRVVFQKLCERDGHKGEHFDDRESLLL